jgi:hypothetical protein
VSTMIHQPSDHPDDGAGKHPQGAPAGGSFLSELRSSEKRDGDAPATPGHGRSAKRFPIHFVVAMAVAALGGAGLMGMRHIGMKSGMSFEADASILPTGNADPAEKARLVRILADLHRSVSSDISLPQRPEKNPFSLASLRPTTQTPAEDDASKKQADAEEEVRQARLREVEAALAGLELNGIIGGGGRFIASIGEKTFRVGDTVSGIFTITAIDGRIVELAADGQLYEISLDDPKPKAKKPGGKSRSSGKAK